MRSDMRGDMWTEVSGQPLPRILVFQSKWHAARTGPTIYVVHDFLRRFGAIIRHDVVEKLARVLSDQQVLAGTNVWAKH